MVAVRLANLVTPLRKGRLPGGLPVGAGLGGRADTDGRAGGVVQDRAVARRRAAGRAGEAKGSPVHHATLGPLEEWLEERPGRA